MPFTFTETEIPGLYIVQPHFHQDQRGSNLKTFHKPSFEEKGLPCDFGETMITTNLHKNVIRGFHYQSPPYTQYKLYFCLQGAWNNYSVDLRKGSPAYGKVICIHMREEERTLLYIPEGIANAHLVLREWNHENGMSPLRQRRYRRSAFTVYDSVFSEPPVRK